MHPLILYATLIPLVLPMSNTRVGGFDAPPSNQPGPVGAFVHRTATRSPAWVSFAVVNTGPRPIWIAKAGDDFLVAGAILYSTSGALIPPNVERAQALPDKSQLVEVKPGEILCGKINLVGDYRELKPGKYYAVAGITRYQDEGRRWIAESIELGRVAIEVYDRGK